MFLFADYNSPPLEPSSVRVHSLYSPFLGSVLRVLSDVWLCLSVIMQMQLESLYLFKGTRMKAGQTWPAHLLSCVQHKNTNVPALTRRDSEWALVKKKKKKRQRQCWVSSMIMEDKKGSVWVEVLISGVKSISGREANRMLMSDRYRGRLRSACW